MRALTAVKCQGEGHREFLWRRSGSPPTQTQPDHEAA